MHLGNMGLLNMELEMEKVDIFVRDYFLGENLKERGNAGGSGGVRAGRFLTAVVVRERERRWNWWL